MKEFNKAVRVGDLNRLQVLVASGGITPGAWDASVHPLVTANQQDDRVMVAFLREHGWNVNTPRLGGEIPPLIEAADRDDLRLFNEYLRLDADPNQAISETPLEFVIGRNRRSHAYVTALLRAGATVTPYAVTKATQVPDAVVLTQLLRYGGEANASNMVLAREESSIIRITPILGSVRDTACAEALLNAGADVHFTDDGGNWTALHALAERDYGEAIEVVLTHAGLRDGGDAFRLDSGDTPLMVAAWTCNLKAIDAFTRFGADLGTQNRDGYSTLSMLRIWHETSDKVTKAFLKRMERLHASRVRGDGNQVATQRTLVSGSKLNCVVGRA